MFRSISYSLGRAAFWAAVGAVGVTAGANGAFAQGAMSPNAVYLPPAGQKAPVSTAAPTCPGIQWYLARSASGQIWGYFFYTDASGVSKANGSIDRQGRFRITLTNLSGNGPVGVATGRRGPNGLINGELTGQGCANLQLNMTPSQPLMGPSAG